jgi:uncharacterized protein (UPF0276 family)
VTGAAARFPLATRSLGMGLDLPWGAPVGFTTDGRGRDGASPRLRAFARAQAPALGHAFFSFQPRDRGRLRAADYAAAWDDLCAHLPPALPRALHHTALNLAATEAPGRGRGELLDFTNALCERHRLLWINEDVGFWSLGGRPLPYPLPPVLDAAGLRACARNVRACQRALVAPLVLEFPGFADGVSVVLGDMDAYDFFRRLADETGAPVTLDVAHLLSWRWWRGFRGEALHDDLDRLPLEACVEVHLSGCEIVGQRFVDAHHGRLIDEQLALLERLCAACPNLRAVTFEDPRLDDGGALDGPSAASLARLRARVARWLADVAPAEPPPREPAPDVRAAEPAAGDDGGGDHDGAIASRLATALTSDAAVAMVRDRRHRGTGRLADAFPACVAGWRRLHPDDADLRALFARFLASPAAAAWREQPGGEPGACVEACFAAFARAEDLADAATVEEELLSALLRTLAVTPEPAFVVPAPVQRAPGGWFALSTTTPPVLHAAVQGRYLRGEVTPLIAFLLRGPGDAATRAGSPAEPS